MLIGAKSKAGLLKRLEMVLPKFDAAGVKLKCEKCFLMTEEVEFLGFKLYKNGIVPADKKLKTITDALSPVNKEELQAYLRLLNFYHIVFKIKQQLLNSYSGRVFRLYG